jgi:hypothetical protein
MNCKSENIKLQNRDVLGLSAEQIKKIESPKSHSEISGITGSNGTGQHVDGLWTGTDVERTGGPGRAGLNFMTDSDSLAGRVCAGGWTRGGRAGGQR